MKTATFAAITMASVAAAIPMCAINCFQSVITEHPPLDCTEPDMYHCFCKMPSLQQYFLDCSYTSGTCATESDGIEAVAFGVDLCSQLGLPITIDTKPPTKVTSTPPEEPTTQPPVETTGSEPKPTDSEEPKPQPTASDDDTSAEPTGSASASASGSTKPSGTGSGPVPSGTSGSETPVIVNAANGKAVSGLLAAAGLVAALI